MRLKLINIYFVPRLCLNLCTNHKSVHSPNYNQWQSLFEQNAWRPCTENSPFTDSFTLFVKKNSSSRSIYARNSASSIVQSNTNGVFLQQTIHQKIDTNELNGFSICIFFTLRYCTHTHYTGNAHAEKNVYWYLYFHRKKIYTHKTSNILRNDDKKRQKAHRQQRKIEDLQAIAASQHLRVYQQDNTRVDFSVMWLQKKTFFPHFALVFFLSSLLTQNAQRQKHNMCMQGLSVVQSTTVCDSKKGADINIWKKYCALTDWMGEKILCNFFHDYFTFHTIGFWVTFDIFLCTLMKAGQWFQLWWRFFEK